MLFKAIFTNSVGTLISRILGFIRDLLTASVLGANIYSDIFFVAFKFPNLFRRIVAEGAFTQTFLPTFTASKHKTLFGSIIFLKFMAFIIVFSILVTIFSYTFTKIFAFGFSEENILLAQDFVVINFYYLDFIFIVAFLSTLLQCKNHFATSAFSTALLNIALIVALLISQKMEKIDIVYYLSYAVLIGGFLQVITHYIASKNRRLNRYFTFDFKLLKAKQEIVEDDTKRFNRQFIPSVFGNSTAQISSFLDTFLASFLITGSISYLYYANRVFQLPLALFAIATSTALFPMVSKAIYKKEIDEAFKMLKKGFWFLAYLLFVSTIIGVIFSDEITKLLFERGEFSQNDSFNTSWALQMYLIGLIPFGLSRIFSLWLYSEHKQIVAAKIAAKSLIANIIFSLILIYPMQHAGLALAGTIGGFILFFLTIKEFGIDKFYEILKSVHLLYLTILSIVVVVVSIFLKDLLHVYL